MSRARLARRQSLRPSGSQTYLGAVRKSSSALRKQPGFCQSDQYCSTRIGAKGRVILGAVRAERGLAPPSLPQESGQ